MLQTVEKRKRAGGLQKSSSGRWFSPDVKKSVEKTKEFANTRSLEMTELSPTSAGGKIFESLQKFHYITRLK